MPTLNIKYLSFPGWHLSLILVLNTIYWQHLMATHAQGWVTEKVLGSGGLIGMMFMKCSTISRADSRFAPSQWETALLCNDVSHWLGASLESVLHFNGLMQKRQLFSDAKETSLLHWYNIASVSPKYSIHNKHGNSCDFKVWKHHSMMLWFQSLKTQQCGIVWFHDFQNLYS